MTHGGPIDVAIIGAGPAGMSAAVEARSHGLSVIVLDEQPAAGGQIYRAIESALPAQRDVLGPDYARGAALAQAFRECGARHVRGASVWQVGRDRTLRYLADGAEHAIEAGAIILCTGALERPFPIPGWTLPGVMTAGAAQILLKGSGLVPTAPATLVGGGPLLYLLAWQYLRGGVPIQAVVDTTTRADYLRAWRRVPAALRGWRMLAKGIGLLSHLRSRRVPLFRGAEALAIEGETHATAIRFDAGGRTHRLPASLVLLHQGVVPNTQITWALRAGHRWDGTTHCWIPRLSDWGELDVAGIYVAGDGAGIAGAQAAALRGRLCALAVAHGQGRLAQRARDAAARPVRRLLQDELSVRPLLDAIYEPKASQRLPADDVVVCRCEEVTAGALREAVRLGCEGPNQLKTFTRCGMGPCQGRQCGLTVVELMADARHEDPQRVGYYRVRSPIQPITLGELAGLRPGP